MTDITVNDITNGSVTGAGVFDKLMVGIKAHIQQEYDEGRIKGSDYATVYLGALQSAMAQSVEVVLRDKQLSLQKELQDVQVESGIVDISIKQAQSEQDLANKYVQQVRLDKEAAMLGLDGVMKEQNQNYTSGYVYTPKYVK